MRFVPKFCAYLLALTVFSASLLSSLVSTADTKTPTAAVMAAPAGPDLNPDPNRQHFDYVLTAGQNLTDEIYISNVGNKAVDVMVYARDSHTSAEGAPAVDGLTQLPKDSGSWVTFGPENTLTYNVHLEVSQRIKLPFSVKVPNDATAGDHTAGILVAYVGAQGNFKLVSRISVPLYARIQGDLQPSLVLSNVRSSYSPSFWSPLESVMKVSFTLTNKGNVVLGGLVKASTLGLFGFELATPSGVRVDEITPGQSLDLTAEIPSVAQWGLYHNTLSVKPTVAKESLIQTELPAISRDDWYFTIPVTWLFIVLTLGICVWYFRFRRQRLKKRTEAWIEYTEAEAERKARLKQDAE